VKIVFVLGFIAICIAAIFILRIAPPAKTPYRLNRGTSALLSPTSPTIAVTNHSAGGMPA